MLNEGWTYILTNKGKTTLYVGVTNDIRRRLWEHQNKAKGFVARYRCWYLVYYEYHDKITYAIAREKQIKRWRREKKEALIDSFNPEKRFFSIEEL